MKKVFSGILIVLMLLGIIGCSVLSMWPNFVTLEVSKNGTYPSPDGKATLVVNNIERRLTLSGSHYEMGYNYGYLLAPEIINAIHEYYSFMIILKYTSTTYTSIMEMQSKFKWDTAYSNELQGMLDGITNKLGQIKSRIYPVGADVHFLCIEDLMLINTVGDWACTSFSVWGTGRSDSSSLMARNFDYPVDPTASFSKYHLVTSFKPDTGKKFVTVGFVGLIGAVSAMNEEGVSVVLHNTKDFPTTDTTGWVPRCIAGRMLIEQMSATNTPEDAGTLLDTLPGIHGNNMFITYPYNSQGDSNVSAALEYDGDNDHPDGRCTVRTVADDANLATNTGFDQRLNITNGLVNANHYLKRTNEGPEAWLQDDTAKRYTNVQARLTNAINADSDVSLDDAQEILSHVGGLQTIHTVLFEPNTKKLRVFYATNGKPAYDTTPFDYTLADLLN